MNPWFIKRAFVCWYLSGALSLIWLLINAWYYCSTRKSFLCHLLSHFVLSGTMYQVEIIVLTRWNVRDGCRFKLEMFKHILWLNTLHIFHEHYSDIIMSLMASQITGVSNICSAVCSGGDQRKYQISVSQAFVRGIHQWLVDSPNKWPVMWKMHWDWYINGLVQERYNSIAYALRLIYKWVSARKI